MRFEFYHEGLLDVPKLSVDGTVPNSIHFSHWQGNETPLDVKADTSTEIALNLVASPKRDELTRGIDLVTNNHFDTDGVLSVWAVLEGERALGLRSELIAAAEAGDFSELRTEDGVRASLVIQGSDQPVPNESILSPLANHLAGRVVTSEAEAYKLVLPEVERVITRTGDYEPLWRAMWQRLERALESFERGQSSVEEAEDARLSVVTLAPEIFVPKGFDPAQHSAPLTAISRYAHGQLFLIAIPSGGGWFYRIDYPYYSWAETVVRTRVRRHNLSEAMDELNRMEGAGSLGRWRLDSNELASAAKYMDESHVPAASKLSPDTVAGALGRALLEADARLAERAGRG